MKTIKIIMNEETVGARPSMIKKKKKMCFLKKRVRG